ncbi:SHOCT domain-containing protein [Halobellus rarus]|uniref:SHOCT domain-containing protein n=1 Tax=Halobellus rarus TaxID=1126237 RepID=A0ABD6CK04_9EURY|nr:SHOCT domain-containing protein [Halobellus rarus]
MNGSGRPRSDRWWDEGLAEPDDPVVGAVALLVLGAGLGSLFGLPVLAAIDFWIIFAIGYAVVVPLVSLLRRRTAGTDPARRGSRNAAQSERADADRSGTDDVDEALARLRDRYARGDLSEEQFERKLEVLLETDTPEKARERVERERLRPDSNRDERKRTQRETGEAR